MIWMLIFMVAGVPEPESVEFSSAANCVAEGQRIEDESRSEPVRRDDWVCVAKDRPEP